MIKDIDIVNQAIKDKVLLYDIVNQWQTLKKCGVNEYVFNCPDPQHQDKTPSCYLNTAKNVCKCFSCGKSFDAITLTMLKDNVSYIDAVKILAEQNGIPIAEHDNYFIPEYNPNYISIAERKKRRKADTAEQPSLIEASTANTIADNALYDYLVKVTGLPDKVQEVFSLYKVGSKLSGADRCPQFNYYDEEGQLHCSKVMKYKSNGHRMHADEDKYCTNTKGSPQHCLFGQHLLNDARFNNWEVGIVESEKSALICSILCSDEILWLATGGKGNLTDAKLKPLKKRIIKVYPDEKGLQNWEAIIEGVQWKYRIEVADWFQLIADEDRAEGNDPDIADVLLRLCCNNCNAIKRF